MALTQPKKPAGGAYGMFLGERRAEFMKACQGQPITAVSKIASEKWKALGEKEKEPYQKRYESAKVQFEKDMAAFLASGGQKSKGITALRSEKRKAREAKLKKKDPNAPKKPAGGGYGVYLAENRPTVVKSLPQGHKMTDVAKKAGEMWRALSDAAKKPYEEKFQKKQAAYKTALEEYKKTLPAEAAAEDEEDDNEDSENEEDEEETVPKKKARTAGA